jgi:ParB-like chromosome segregation protein Spo0J
MGRHVDVRKVAEWKRLAEQKEAEAVSEQNVQKLSTRGRSGEGRPEGGTAKAARDLPIPGPTEERHHQPTIRIEHDEEEDGGEFPVLITGLHRIEALKRLGAKYVDCVVFDGDETEARLWEISENLHRAELTELEWSEHVAEWKRLAEQKEAEGFSEQNVQKIAKDGTARGRPEGGTAKAARTLPIPGPTEDARRKQVERAVKIAGIAPEAKEAAAAAGLANSQTALLAVAQAEPEHQVGAVEQIAARKAYPVPDVDPAEREFNRLTRAWEAASEPARDRFMAHVRWFGRVCT